MPTIRHPDTGQEIEDRRRAPVERRQSPGRREQDYGSGFTPVAAVWAIVGAIVCLYLFFVAIGGVDPDKAPVATIVVLVLAVVWFAHAWRRLWTGGFSPRSDRERRGF